MHIVKVFDNLHKPEKVLFMIIPDAEHTIRTLLRGFPIVTITGPRQSGKTTLARMVARGKPYVSLEDPDQRLAAHDAPALSLNVSLMVAFSARCNAARSFSRIPRPGSMPMAAWASLFSPVRNSSVYYRASASRWPTEPPLLSSRSLRGMRSSIYAFRSIYWSLCLFVLIILASCSR